jgi:acetyl esterase/lipase
MNRMIMLMALMCCLPAADAQEGRKKTFEEIVNAPVVLQLPRMDEVRVIADQPYASTKDPRLLMDIYLPPGLKDGERRPVVVFIHGGTGRDTRPKDWGIYRSWGRLAAASGFVAVTFTHRLGYPEPWLAKAGQDAGEAIDFVRRNADRLHANPDLMGLAAYSAGGPLLTLGLDEKRPYVRCLIAYYAFLDIQQSKLHRDSESAEQVRQYSVIEHLGETRARTIPMFVARAGRDEIPTMNDSIDRFVARAIRDNANVVVWNHPEGVHGFDNQNDDDRSREIIAASLAFMKTHLHAAGAARVSPAG